MKRFILPLLLAPATLSAAAALPTSVGDTIINVEDVHRVVVTERADTLCVDLRGLGADSTFRFRYGHAAADSAVISVETRDGRSGRFPFLHRAPGQLRHWSGPLVAFGFLLTPGAPADMATSMAASQEAYVELGAFHRYTRNERHDFAAALAWEMNFYELAGHRAFHKDAAGRIVLVPYPEGARIGFSRLWVMGLAVPLRYTFHFSRHVQASLGAHVRFNFAGRLRSRCYLDGIEREERTGRIHQSPVTVDFKASVDVHHIGVYVKGSPCRVLRDGYGPSFSNLSVGLQYVF